MLKGHIMINRRVEKPNSNVEEIQFDEWVVDQENTNDDGIQFDEESNERTKFYINIEGIQFVKWTS